MRVILRLRLRKLSPRLIWDLASTALLLACAWLAIWRAIP